ncbi:MAG: hypothetical protein P857_310 [Candidatus Xenolissoclinum pacificiensis L6]|uniref:Rod shape-determining protein MreD n=1 Tax=Candidatus Xenolissoclinum pacificiensis L6 TaxID=1401685 RepID=W2UZV7_9RICK|nr:MAG: hypothetical protein P857_310 [Candidatus Xenolissoclinum pacificiensis L6]
MKHFYSNCFVLSSVLIFVLLTVLLDNIVPRASYFISLDMILIYLLFMANISLYPYFLLYSVLVDVIYGFPIAFHVMLYVLLHVLCCYLYRDSRNIFGQYFNIRSNIFRFLVIKSVTVFLRGIFVWLYYGYAVTIQEIFIGVVSSVVMYTFCAIYINKLYIYCEKKYYARYI